MSMLINSDKDIFKEVNNEESNTVASGSGNLTNSSTHGQCAAWVPDDWGLGRISNNLILIFFKNAKHVHNYVYNVTFISY